MPRLTGQAARHTGRALHAVLTVALVAVLALGAGVGVLAWRLAQEPLDVPWLARRLEAAVNREGAPTRLEIAHAALAWEGFRAGVDRPLDLRLGGVRATDAAGTVIDDVLRAQVSLSVGALLLGYLRPRAIEVDGARLRLARGPDGALSFDLAALAETDGAAGPPDRAGPGLFPGLISELARPAATDRGAAGRSIIAHLRRIRVRGAALVVVDRQLGATWRAAAVDLDLARLPGGGLEGSGRIELALGEQRTLLRLDATLSPGGARTELRARLAEVDPAALARAAPGLAPLAALAAPVSLTAALTIGPELALADARLDAEIGPGHARLGAATVALDGGRIAAEGNAQAMTLTRLEVAVRPRDGGPLTHLQANGTARRAGKTIQAALTLSLDRVAFADLPVLWPEGAGGHARGWVTQNITAGTAKDGRVELGLQAAADLSDVTLTQASGGVAGEGLTLHWLRPVPPIERAQAKLRILDPDTLEITAEGGQQRLSQPGGAPLAIRGGRMRVSGIVHAQQVGAIEAEIAGPLAEAIALLRHPRLRLLDKHPLPIRDPSGQATARLSVQLPFEDKVKIEDVAIRAEAHLDDVHLGDVAAGRSLDGGVLDLQAGNDGLTLKGRGSLAGIAADLGAEMDFRPGPPGQVVQKVTVAGRASAAQMAAAGIDPGPLLAGSADIQAVLTGRRDGKGSLQADADLTAAALSAAPLGWRKPAGGPARLSARLVLERDKLAGVEAIALEGSGLSVYGQAEAQGGRIEALRFERMVIGRTEARGVVRFPPPAPAGGRAGPIEASFSGALLDLSGVAARRPEPAPGQRAPARPNPTEPDPRGGRSFVVDVRFDRALMAADASLSGLAAHAEYDGRLFTRLQVDGRTAPAAPFRLEIVPRRGGRRVSASAADTGALLQALDVSRAVQGGRLSLSGGYDDQRADHPLSGVAQIEAFRVRDPNGLGRLLQAMTLYGLVEAASGPGLGFTRLNAPFVLTDEALELGESRAFSPSLGLTATGRVDLKRDVADLQGTIVPAYFFNSMLGNIPLIGRLFSPERGGGVFAATYRVRGPMDNPQVTVNPLAALTPGFLRELFGLF